MPTSNEQTERFTARVDLHKNEKHKTSEHIEAIDSTRIPAKKAYDLERGMIEKIDKDVILETESMSWVVKTYISWFYPYFKDLDTVQENVLNQLNTINDKILVIDNDMDDLNSNVQYYTKEIRRLEKNPKQHIPGVTDIPFTPDRLKMEKEVEEVVKMTSELKTGRIAYNTAKIHLLTVSRTYKKVNLLCQALALPLYYVSTSITAMHSIHCLMSYADQTSIYHINPLFRFLGPPLVVAGCLLTLYSLGRALLTFSCLCFSPHKREAASVTSDPDTTVLRPKQPTTTPTTYWDVLNAGIIFVLLWCLGLAIAPALFWALKKAPEDTLYRIMGLGNLLSLFLLIQRLYTSYTNLRLTKPLLWSSSWTLRSIKVPFTRALILALMITVFLANYFLNVDIANLIHQGPIFPNLSWPDISIQNLR
ncbi:hypothetical protein NEDG_00224 [Nematocida displodere]|uniref:Uncharacterized protein n=1 Tax=Nematocida displodere TaxID=1805483 RepID=A0A177EL93_9MICR|nr:hypothetical protein NEDG_00224 [Nematocida displodere]